MDKGKGKAHKRLGRTAFGRSAAKSISYILLALACATNGFTEETADSLYSLPSLRKSVREVLTRYGRDSFPIGYGFEASDLLNPGNLEALGWDARVREAWLYDPEPGPGCRKIKDIRPDDPGWRGFITDSEDRSGDTIHISGWEVYWVYRDVLSGSNISFSSSVGIDLTKSGDTVEVSAGGLSRDSRTLGRVSRTALYFDGLAVHPEAEKCIRDSIVYEDSSGKRFGCDRTSSIQIVLNSSDGSFWSIFAGPKKGIRTVRCKTLPTRCPPDTGEIIRSEINKRIDGYRFTIRDSDGLCHEAIFRTRAECKRYAHRCAKMDRKRNN
jgi:hypothetical protein